MQHAPTKPRGWVNLGRAEQLSGNLDAALKDYHLAIRYSFDERRVHGTSLYARLAAETDTATVLLEKGNLQGAWNQIAMVLRDPEWPLFPYAVFHRGVMEAITNQCAAADRDFDLAVRGDGTLQRPPMPIHCQQQGFQ